MLSSVEQAFVGRDEKRASLKTPAWEATVPPHMSSSLSDREGEGGGGGVRGCLEPHSGKR